jgi:hypothetical protein
LASTAPEPTHRRFIGDPLTGSEAGAWCPYGRATDFPPDQRGEDGRSLTFTTMPLGEPVEILGRATVTVSLSVDRPVALLVARLCDVSPEGRSLLVSRGLINLTHREGHDRTVRLTPGTPMSVTFPLDFAGHRFPPGHQLRLSLSPTYWPFAWPSPEPVTIDIALGEETFVTLPERAGDADDGPLPSFGEAERAAPPAGDVREVADRTLVHHAGTGEIRSTVLTEESSCLRDTRLSFGERQEITHILYDDDPLAARLEYRAEHHLQRDDWTISVLVDTSVSADADAFTVTTDLDAYEGLVRVHCLRRSVQIPRDGN